LAASAMKRSCKSRSFFGSMWARSSACEKSWSMLYSSQVSSSKLAPPAVSHGSRPCRHPATQPSW
jgi:hypothetical protein